MEYFVKPPIYVTSVQNLSSFLDKSYSNVLLLTSPTVYQYLDSKGIINSIKEGRTLQIYSAIKPNAPLNQIDEIKKLFVKPSVIIGIGGGSVLDSAKALSVAWGKIPISDYFYKKVDLRSDKIHTIAIPTTAGTGAEVSYGAILEDSNLNIKGGLRGEIVQPNVVIIDIDLYKLAPSKLMSEVGFDCLTHAIETYLSTSSSPLIKYQSVAAINVIFRSLPNAVRLKDTQSVTNMALASCMMGINLAKSTTCLPHRIQYVIGPITKTSHSQGLVMLYNGWLPEISKHEAFKELSENLALTSNGLVEKINRLKRELNLTYSLKDYGITTNDVSDLALKVTGNLGNDPCYSGILTIEKIIENSL